MATKRASIKHIKQKSDRQLLQTISEDVRQIKEELFWLTLPEENWDDYDDPEEIKRAYQEAIKQYPPKI